MHQSILVPVDGSISSRKALEVAAALVERRQGTLHVLNVQDRPLAADTLGRAAGAPASNADAIVQSSGQEVIDSVLKDAPLPTERVRSQVRTGEPAKVVIAEAERLGVDAIVMGSRGASGIGSLVLGSVSQRVLSVAPCTVIVVR